MPGPALRCHERDTPFLPAQHQPAVLLDIALSRDIAPDQLLLGSRLFYADILSGQCRVAPEQLHVLLHNLQRRLGEETGFLCGQRWLPGHYGAASLALRHCANLQEALILLCKLSLWLSPMLTPRLWLGRQYAWLYWHDGWGAGPLRPLLVEASATAVMNLSRILCRQRVPWLCLFSHTQPRHIEQYWVHLGQDIRFEQPLNLMRIPRAWLSQPNPEAAATIFHLNLQQGQAEMRASGASMGFLDLCYHMLAQHVEQGPTLEFLAQEFSCSPATLKRRLRKHGTHFQALYDKVRMHLALKYFLSDGLGSETVAARLQFHDNANFRRSFKRWTGQTPSLLMDVLS